MSTSQRWVHTDPWGSAQNARSDLRGLGGARGSAFLASSPVVARLKLCSAHRGSQALDLDSQNWFDCGVLRYYKRSSNIPLRGSQTLRW